LVKGYGSFGGHAVDLEEPPAEASARFDARTGLCALKQCV
jgi:hypothetical protein